MSYTPGPWGVLSGLVNHWVLRAGEMRGGDAVGYAMREEDAQLMAKAPDLLKALKEARWCVQNNSYPDNMHEWDAVIAEAEGEKK